MALPVVTPSFLPLKEGFSQGGGGHFYPRTLVLINKIPVVPCSWDLETNAHGATDSAKIVFTISQGPDWSTLLQATKQTNTQPLGKPVGVEIYAGFPPNPNPGSYGYGDLSRRFMGIVDQFEPNFDTDEVTFSCRSAAAILTAQKQLSNLSMTTDAYVRSVAAMHQLKPIIHFAPGQVSLPMPKVFGHEVSVGLKDMRQWDILILCAEAEAMDVWVQGNELHYESPDYIARQRIAMVWGRDLINFHGIHAPQFSKHIEVEVRSYTKKTTTAHSARIRYNADGTIRKVKQSVNVRQSIPNFGFPGGNYTTTNIDPKTGKIISETIGSTTSSGGVANTGYGSFKKESATERYVYVFQNLSLAECLKRRDAIWAQISMHEYVAEFEFPMRPEYLAKLKDGGITTLYELSGLPYNKFNTGADKASLVYGIPFGNAYRPRRTTEKFEIGQSPTGTSGGWTVKVTAVNHDLGSGGGV